MNENILQQNGLPELPKKKRKLLKIVFILVGIFLALEIASSLYFCPKNVCVTTSTSFGFESYFLHFPKKPLIVNSDQAFTLKPGETAFVQDLNFTIGFPSMILVFYEPFGINPSYSLFNPHAEQHVIFQTSPYYQLKFNYTDPFVANITVVKNQECVRNGIDGCAQVLKETEWNRK